LLPSRVWNHPELVDNDNPEPKLPTSYYNGPDKVLAETTARALSAIHTILSELLKQADLSDNRRKFLQRNLNTVIENAVFLDWNLGPG
jgi:hypothetical protein